ncbi:MAG TPA: dihydrolipoyl dehydrogenase [Polyangiaceae bacterium]|nr:dihydrolipoyl dehydrogenase [Polyangiaceae bacterium]
MRHVKVAIIGAGTAGLSARREVERLTDDYVVIDDGALGTTCARVGCMPSKVLIQVANDFHRRGVLEQQGILGGDQLTVDQAAVMRHVRKLRDRFVGGVMRSMGSWEDKLIRKRASFVDANTLRLESKDGAVESLRADRIILATGSKPVIPGAWQALRHRLIDTDEFFERETLPARVAVVGLGVIGLELGQALSRLGVQVTGITLDQAYGGLTDPDVQAAAHAHFSAEFPVHLHGVKHLEERGDDLHIVLSDGTTVQVDAALVTMGRRPQLESLGLERLDCAKELTFVRGVPEFSDGTFRVAGAPWYVAGDMNGTRPLLHEAADEGRIAGYNSVRDEDKCFQRRTPLAITFSDPNIAMVGESFRALAARGADFVTGSVSFKGQGRAVVKREEHGLLHVYADRESGRLLGAELLAPSGEHLAHQLAWALSTKSTARDTLSFPFYHPVLEEGLRTALRKAARQVGDGNEGALETLRCGDGLESMRCP